jgi:hypothetical protein
MCFFIPVYLTGVTSTMACFFIHMLILLSFPLLTLAEISFITYVS